jgi:PAS domain S-box-containing protein
MATKGTMADFAQSPQLHSERVFRYLVDSVTDYSIFILDPQGHIATWNPGAERMEGYRAQEIIGQHFSVFYTQADQDQRKPDYELKVAAEVGRFEDEGWRVRKDGSRFWANVIITRLRDDAGRLVGFGKIVRDFTERREAEQRYRQLIETVEDYAIFSLDPHGVVRTWNSGAQRIKGYKADEIIGKHFSTFYTEEDRAGGLPAQMLERALREGHAETEGWRVRKDGSKFWSLVVITAIRDGEGNLTGFSKVTRDMTNRKRLLDQIRQYAHELELRIAERDKTNAELEAFSYSVSHDLRAPLRAVSGFADALKEDYFDKLDDTGRDYLAQILNAAARMNQLVTDLLNYSRLSRVDMVTERVSVADACAAALAELDRDAEHVKLEATPGHVVCAHQATLVQVLFNLITNGLKFHAPDQPPQVTVRSERIGDRVRIAVSDRGIGIAPQHRDRIFKVFERLHGQDSYPGTGIGLAIVKRGVERMDGTVGLDSEPGRGSTFWIELPAAEGCA